MKLKPQLSKAPKFVRVILWTWLSVFNLSCLILLCFAGSLNPHSSDAMRIFVGIPALIFGITCAIGFLIFMGFMCAGDSSFPGTLTNEQHNRIMGTHVDN